MTETARLRRVLSGMANVCVVEQFVYTGVTLNYANELLKDAKVPVRTAMRGLWYQGVSDGLNFHKVVQIDGDKASSPTHDNKMYEIGARAAERYLKSQ